MEERGLYGTITTLHCGREYQPHQKLQRMRDSFRKGDIYILRWGLSAANIVDKLEKRNPASHTLINAIATSGKLELDWHGIYELGSKKWK